MKLKDTFKTFPTCEDCVIPKRCPHNKEVLCATARTIMGNCPKDLWLQRIEKEVEGIRLAQEDRSEHKSDYVKGHADGIARLAKTLLEESKVKKS